MRKISSEKGGLIYGVEFRTCGDYYYASYHCRAVVNQTLRGIYDRRLPGSSDFPLWKRISGRMESVTSGYAGRECMGDAGSLLFGGLISLLTDSKGSFGFSKYISKVCNTERKTLMTTFIMGILIFVDDYLNVLSIGTCMKKISDKQKIPRETLAYLLDSTGAPVCVLLPFSTWAVFYASLFYEQDSVKALGVTSAMGAYLKAIPFLFYPTITLIIVFLFVVGWMPKIGPMKKAYKRVEETGKVYSDASRKYNHENPELDG